MAFTVTINFAQDDLNAEIRNAYAAQYGYQDTVPDPTSTPEVPLPNIPNPVTKAQFRDQQIKRQIKECVAWYRAKLAQDAIVVTPVED